MPRRMILAPTHDQNKSLGWLATAWIEFFVRHGPGDVQGQPVVHGEEYTEFIVNCYAQGEHARNNHMLYDSAFLSRPKGCDKSGMAGRICLFEALGPARFAGWAKGGEIYRDPYGFGFEYEYQPGEPMGRPVVSPFVRILATEENQPLALDTAVPTPDGWTTVGELKVGDMVIDAGGRPVRVARETRVMEGMDCYEVVFSDGERIVASGSHEWTLERRTGKGTRFDQVTVTTEELSRDYIRAGGSKRYRVSAGVEWQLPPADLAVDPYLLGLWLGDGKTNDSTIATDSRLTDEIESIVKPLLLDHEEIVWQSGPGNQGSFRIRRRPRLCPWGHHYGDDVHDAPAGKSCGPCHRDARGKGTKLLTFRERLREIGALGSKHIPARYLRASAEQRHALLQGLMDSDGNFSRHNNASRACFTNTNRRLIDDVEELLTTLGYKWYERAEPSVNAWRVFFVPDISKPVARLGYKVAAHPVVTGNPRSRRRHVASVQAVQSVPVKCIGIDTDDHLFLVGRRAVATHNTGNTFRTVHYNLTDRDCPLYHWPGIDAAKREIFLADGGEIRCSTASASSKDGGLETHATADETHLYVTDELREMKDVVSANMWKRKRGAGTWMLETTTMFEPGEQSSAEGTFDEADALAEGRKKRGSHRLYFDHRWGDVPDLADEQSLRQGLRDAYGDALAWMDEDSLVDSVYDTRTKENRVRRYMLNAKTSAQDAWIKEHEWRSCRNPAKEIKLGDTITLGFDGSWNNDATALVACRVEDGHLELLACWEQPDGPEAEGWTVPRDEVDAAVSRAMADYDVVGMYADPPHWTDWLDAWHNQWAHEMKVQATARRPFEWFTNQPRQMVEALDRFHTAVLERRLSYTPADDRVGRKAELTLTLQRHVLNGRARETRAGTQVYKEYKKSPKKIDAAIAAVLAFQCRWDAVAAGVLDQDQGWFMPRRIR